MFGKIEISRQSCCEVTVNSKDENSLDFFSGFCPRIRPLDSGHFYRSSDTAKEKIMPLKIYYGSITNPGMPTFPFSEYIIVQHSYSSLVAFPLLLLLFTFQSSFYSFP